MAWSIREIAELAGVSQRAVRHYNQIGLLEQPARRANGYKQYDRTHLVRLLQVKRLSELGFSLSRIAAMSDDSDVLNETVHSLDAELAGTIERLQRARAELGRILQEGTPTDLPPGFSSITVSRRMTEADRSFVVLMSRVLGPGPRQAYADLLRNLPTDPANREFETLRADADDRTCRDLAERMMPFVRDMYLRYPALKDLHAGSPHGTDFAREATEAARHELYNAAQLDVMRRIRAHLARSTRSALS